jgi:hypothetical protein
LKEDGKRRRLLRRRTRLFYHWVPDAQNLPDVLEDTVR